MSNLIRAMMGASGGTVCEDRPSNTKLLVHSSHANTSTTFTDSSASTHTMTANGNVQHSTAQAKFGGSSILFDGTGDYLSAPDHADFDVVGVNFTFACFVRPTQVGNVGVIAAKLASLYVGWEFGLDNLSQLYILVGNGSNGFDGNDYAATYTALTVDTWYHVALVKNGTNWKTYLNGVNLGSETATGDDQTDVFAIGADVGWTEGSPRFYQGYIDEPIYTKSALWTSNFTPPEIVYC